MKIVGFCGFVRALVVISMLLGSSRALAQDDCNDPCNPACPNYDYCACNQWDCACNPWMCDPCFWDPYSCACNPWYCNDSDGDGFADYADGCPWEYGACNGCPCDQDGDGVPDASDNCPATFNPNQLDCNANGIGDACETFTDCNGNGKIDTCDIFEGRSLDTNGNLIPDECEIGQALLRNGGFEQSSVGGCVNNCFSSCHNANSLVGWTTPTEYGYDSYRVDLHQNRGCSATVNPRGGQYFISLQGSVCCNCDNDGFVEQIVSLVPNRRYRLSMDVYIDDAEALNVSLGGWSASVNASAVPTYTWTQVTWDIFPTGQSATLRVAAQQTGDREWCIDADNAAIDNLSLELVPIVDSDGDGIDDALDPCPGAAGPCNGCPEGPCGCGIQDRDGDGVQDCVDNCPDQWNPDQTDSDGDGQGDVCDPCPTNDPCNPACANYDPCACSTPCTEGCPSYDPCVCNPWSCDRDGDGVPDLYDPCPDAWGECNGCPAGPCGCGNPDMDGDGILDCLDNCPGTSNPSQSDCDGDGIGDACDGGPERTYYSPDFYVGYWYDCCDIERSNNFNTLDWPRAASDVRVRFRLQAYGYWNWWWYYQTYSQLSVDGFGANGNTYSWWCGWQPEVEFTVPAQHFNQAIGDGQLNLSLRLRGFQVYPDCGYSYYGATFIYQPDNDCNENGVPDNCDIASGFARDCNGNGFPDSCDIARSPGLDCDLNGQIDQCEIWADQSLDCNWNGTLDRCEIMWNPSIDCDSNGKLDQCELWDPANDRNGNGRLDRCDITDGTLEDCNGNWIPDFLEQYLDLSLASPRLSPIGASAPQSWTIPYAGKALAGTNVKLRVSVRGDFSLASEHLVAYLNGRYAGVLWRDPGTQQGVNAFTKKDCGDPWNWWGQEWDTLVIPADVWNAAGDDAQDMVVEFRPTIAVSASQCPASNPSWLDARVEYTAAVEADCNGNGLLDSCECSEFPELDINQNGIPDECDGSGSPKGCQGDVDLNGVVDHGDLSILLMMIHEPVMPGDPNDVTGDGIVDTADLSVMLMCFGPCP